MEPPLPNNIIATGLPRSGTTLTCHLLNKLPDTVALHEPMDLDAFFRAQGTEAQCAEISGFFASTRGSLATRKVAFSRQVDGKVPDNHVPDAPVTEGGLRKGDAPRGEVLFDKELPPNFSLVVKHPVLFTAMLEVLTPRFFCFAVIRNPLAVLGSWSTVQMPVREGRAPNAERLHPALKEALDAIPDRLDRQLHILSWFFAMYARALPPERIVRYEETIATGGRNLAGVIPSAAGLSESLASRNQSALYQRETTQLLGEKLLNSDGAYWDFYPRESVAALLG